MSAWCEWRVGGDGLSVCMERERSAWCEWGVGGDGLSVCMEREVCMV